MAQIFDPISSEQRSAIICCYVNATSRIQVARITNMPNWYFERVVFPGQRLIFETMPDSLLEIHCGMMASAILADTIPCDRLQIEEEIISSSTPDHEHRLEELNDGLGSATPLVASSTSITTEVTL